MFTRIATTVFNASVMLVAATVAVWLTAAGHTREMGGLLMGLGAVLGAVTFGFRLAGGAGPDRLSIWAGPLRSTRPGPPVASARVAPLRRAA